MKPYVENNHNKDTELNHIEEFRTDRSGDNVERDYITTPLLNYVVM